MTRRFLIAAVFSPALVFATAPAMAQPPAPAKPPCLTQINIYDFSPVPGNRSLVVTDRLHKRYRLNFMGICNGLQFHVGLRFKTFGSNLSCVARGDSVITRDVAGPPSCIIKDIQYQTPAMDQTDAAALAKKNR
jgi:hypothetical protein